MTRALLLLILLIPLAAQAAKVPVTVQSPTLNTDGSPLTDLASIRIEWGSCVGNAFGTPQASIAIPATPGAILAAAVYPTGLSIVCIRAYAVTRAGIESDPSNPVTKQLSPVLGRPTTLGQPVTLP